MNTVYLLPSCWTWCWPDKTGVHELLSVMDISAEIPLHALTQEDTLSLRLEVLPMKPGCKGRAPSFWHHYFLACPGQRGLHAVTSEGLREGRSSARGGTAEDAQLLFPCSPQPMKTLENDTFPSAKPGDTATSGKAWVNTKGKATGWEGGGGVGGCEGAKRAQKSLWPAPLWMWTYYQPPVLHLG